MVCPIDMSGEIYTRGRSKGVNPEDMSKGVCPKYDLCDMSNGVDPKEYISRYGQACMYNGVCQHDIFSLLVRMPNDFFWVYI